MTEASANNAPDPDHGFSVVVPAYNEGLAVGDVVRRIIATMTSTGQPFEVIVVDDGSSDDTAEGARDGGATVVSHPQNAGYGAALKTGITRARYDHIVITDADGTYPIDRIPDLMAHADRFDMVVGARTGANYRESWFKEPARIIFGAMVEWVTGTSIPDVNSGLRVFRTALARQYFHVISQGYSFTTTITLAALSNGYFVKYLPIDYHRRVGSSKVRLARDIPRTTQIVLQACVYYNPIKLFLTFAVGTAILAVLAWALWLAVGTTPIGVLAALLTVSVIHFVGVGMLADLIRVRNVPRAPTVTSQGAATVTRD
jgi:glycosyltransferase involved in cell wall biosynthesis